MSYSLDQSLGFAVNRVANRLKAGLEQGFIASGFDVTAEQWSILTRLWEADGLAQHELAHRMSKDKTNMARILGLMESHQWIERRVDPEDNRVRNIYLTDYGRSLQTKLVPIAQEVLDRAQKGLDNEEIRHLIHMLNSIYENLE